MQGRTGQTGLILDTSNDRDQTDFPNSPARVSRAPGDRWPPPHHLKSIRRREAALITPKSEPSSSLESGSFQRPPKSKHSHLTSWEEGKKGDAKITFVGSINTPVCQSEIRPSPRDSGASFLWATGVVNDQHNIDAIGLQQVHKKTPVSLGV